MRIEIITDGNRLKQVGPDWHTLWQQSQAGVFQAHCWISAWWHEFQDHQLRIACAWEGDNLVAVMPLCIQRWHGIRILEWAAQPFSDYCDVIYASEAISLETIWSVMWPAVEAVGGYDLVRMKHVRPDAAIKPLLYDVASEERSELCLQVAREWPTGAAWHKTLNKKTKNNLARGGRILSERGDIVFRQIDDNEPRAPVITRLLALKRIREENRDSPLVRSNTILLALAGALDRLASLKIFVIEHAGTIIAGSINAVQGDRMLALFATYDPAYERASPGILLMTDYTKWAFDNGIVEIDYLLGAEPYKFRFANRKVRLHIFVAARTIVGRLALVIYNKVLMRRQPDPEVLIGSAYRTEKGTERVKSD